jgi:RHS repeat-associated protein
MTIHQPELGQTLHFAPVSVALPAELGLTAMTDRHSNSITVSYSEQGVPMEVVHSGGYRIAVSAEGDRITGFVLSSAPDAPVLSRYEYDEAGRLTHVHDASGNPERLFYDDRHRISGWEDRVGTRFHYAYDAQGRCIRTDGPDGYMQGMFQYDDEGGRTFYTDSLGHTTTYELNRHLQVVRETDPLGASTVREWDRYDRLLSETDPLGRTTRYTYDGQGDLVEVRLPDGSAVRAEYNELHQPVTLVEADGARWQRSYDARGNLLRLEDPAGAITRYAYDHSGARTVVIDPLGAEYRIRNDTAGLPSAITDPLGGATRYERNSLGQAVDIIEPTGACTTLTWGTDGRLLARRLADGSTERWEYGPGGHLVSHTSAAGAITRYEQGPFGLPVALTQPDGSRLTYDYDTELRLTTVTNSLGQRWSYEYDAVGNLLCERDFSGRRTTYRFDAAGQPVERTNGAGQRLVCTFDARGQLVTQTTGHAEIRYRYDPAGRLLEAVGPDAVVTYERDALGSVLRETCNGLSLELEYDLLGRRIRRRTPAGSIATWEYDEANRLTALHTAGSSVRLAYDSAGREVERALGAGAVLSQAWDAAGRTIGQTLSFSGSAVAAGGRRPDGWQRTYGYRSDNFLTEIVDSSSGRRQFTLDADGRILTANSPQARENYAYDAAGNLVDSRLMPESARADEAPSGHRAYDGMLLRRHGRTRYDYDGQGRVTSATRRLLSGGARTWHYQWDAFDRLTDVVTPDGRRWHYLYDPHGRRIAKLLLANDGTVAEQTDFVWEGTRLAERIQPRGDSTLYVTTWHWQPGEHRPLAQTELTCTSSGGLPDRQRKVGHEEFGPEEVETRFYAIVTDLIGTPTELIDDDGRTCWSRHTSVWGVPGGADRGDLDCPLGFPGQYHDSETGLDYNVRRYYDAENGRYISPDPLGLDAAPNNYAYVLNPFTWSDPFGLACTDLGGWYGKLSPARPGNEINHIPAKAAYSHLSLTPHMGPAIRMERRDHRLVSSTDSRGYSATPWRNTQRDLIDQGKFDEAMKMDIDDIRARFGEKYDQHIADMVSSLKDNAGLQKMLTDNGWTINYDLLK